MTRTLRTLLACAVLATALPAVPARATTVVALSDADLVRNSTRVVRGFVVGIDVVRYAIEPQAFTEVTVAIEETLLTDGTLTDTLVVRVPGGRLDDRAVVVPGMPSFELGEQVVLFLEPLPAAFGPDAEPGYLPVGLEQGVWRPVGLNGWRRGDQDGLIGPALAEPEPLPLATLRAWCAGGLP